MAHLWQVFRFELIRNVRRKGYLFMTFGLPLLALVLLLGYQVITKAGVDLSPKPSSVPGLNGVDLKGITKAGYVDLSGLFPDPGELSSVFTRYPDETSARAAMDAGQIDLYYLIPADYLQSGSVTAVMPRLNLAQADTDYIRRLTLNGLATGVTDQSLFNRLTEPANFQEISIRNSAPQGGISRNAGSAFLVVYLFGIILMISLFVTNGYLMQSVIEEKETRLIEILISTVRPVQLLSGKILALGLLGISQMVVWFVSFALIVRFVAASQFGPELDALASAAIPVNMMPLILLYFALGYLLFAACYSIVGALSSSLREGPQYAVLFTLPAALPFYFISLFIEAPDSALPTILSIFPLTAPLSMIQRLAASPDTIPVWQIGLSVGLLVLSTLGLMWLAGRLFRVQTLLAGQTPKLKDIPRLVRG